MPDSEPALDEINAVVSLVAKLPADSATRQAAVAFIHGAPVEALPPAKHALLNPGRVHWRAREAAAWLLGRAPLSPEDADTATVALMDTVENAHGGDGWPLFKRAFAMGGVFCAVMMVLLCIGMGPPPEAIDFIPATLVLQLVGTALAMPVAAAYSVWTRNRVRAAAATALGRLGSPEALGVLAGALNGRGSRDARVRAAAADALHALLPRLDATHYGLFGAQTMHHLGRALNHPDTELVLKTLRALEAVGTSHAIPYVKRAAQSGRLLRVREAAERTLDALERRQTLEGQRDRLLRPTAAPDQPAAVLLRAAGDTPAEPRVLLRAVGDDMTDDG